MGSRFLAARRSSEAVAAKCRSEAVAASELAELVGSVDRERAGSGEVNCTCENLHPKLHWLSAAWQARLRTP
jgi:hypothetical protein